MEGEGEVSPNPNPNPTCLSWTTAAACGGIKQRHNITCRADRPHWGAVHEPEGPHTSYPRSHCTLTV